MTAEKLIKKKTRRQLMVNGRFCFKETQYMPILLFYTFLSTSNVNVQKTELESEAPAAEEILDRVVCSRELRVMMKCWGEQLRRSIS